MKPLTIAGIRIITHEWMPKGYVAVQNGAPWPDTHTVILTPDGKVLDMGRPRDIFPPPCDRLSGWMDGPVAERQHFIP